MKELDQLVHAFAYGFIFAIVFVFDYNHSERYCSREQ